MATAEPVVKEKKKNRLRGRFLLSQAASLDGAMGRGNGTYSSSESTSPHDCQSAESGSTSRIRRILFRRSRSEDRMRNLRIKALNNTSDGPDSSLVASDDFPRLAAVAIPAAVVIDNPAAEVVDLIRPNSDHTPRSPPPPYELSSEAREAARVAGNLSPPSYDEAMGHNVPTEPPRVTPTLYWANHDQRGMVSLDYCTCLECQTRNLTLDEDEQEDNCSDAVFPMETHVLMQEVLADGMAFCTLM